MNVVLNNITPSYKKYTISGDFRSHTVYGIAAVRCEEFDPVARLLRGIFKLGFS